VDRRFLLFSVLVALIFVVNQIVFSYLFPPPPKPPAGADKQVAQAKDGKAADKAPADQGAEGKAGDEPADKKAAANEPADQPADAAAPGEQPAGEEPAAAQAAEEPQTEPLRGTLGSGNHDSPFRMLVTWNNRGGAIERIELNSPNYRALDDRTGYLGYLAPQDAPKRGGALVRVVGAGTPAAVAKMEQGDLITAIDGLKIRTAQELLNALRETEPGDQIEITVLRGASDQQAEHKLTATLGTQPLDLVRAEKETHAVPVVEPGNHDPLSFLTTIQQFDDRSLPNDDKELGGVNLKTAPWEVVQSSDKVVSFRKRLPVLGLEITKTYKLETVPDDQRDNVTYPAYGLALEVSVANIGDKPHQVAYRLDGPTGLPIEGAWFASKVSHSWGTAGLRDIIVQFAGGSLEQVTPGEISAEDFEKDWGATASLDFIAVDAQYFSAALIPKKKDPGEILFQSIRPIKAGSLPKDSTDTRLLNVSFRIDSEIANLEPGGPPLKHEFTIFAGPKRPALLAQYGNGSLSGLVYFGWFGPVARLLSHVLHAFYFVVGNYGIAIVMLTVLVRGCMFPLSRKQALGAQKMQELQPEMKRINEKYKNDAEKRTRATQELFRTHQYNPLGGCLLAFAQLPIFVGLYRSLMVDVELRQAPLISESIRWASNLAAPDMLWNWVGVMPEFVTSGQGILGLGPYLNVLPLVTIALFIWQQKMFMPPPADEQAAMQQKMMQYMMIFMGVLFFKVASGLCVYFIASSLWGVAERKLLPKAKPAGGSPPQSADVAVTSPPSGNGSAGGGKKRQRGRK